MVSKLIPTLLIVSFLALVAVNGKQPRSIHSSLNDAIEKEILRLEELGRQKVLKGETNWDELIEDQAYMTAFDGSVIRYQKGQELPALPVKSFELSDLIVRVYGEVAVVTGLADFEGETPQKVTIKVQQRYLNIWKKSGNGWKIAVSQTTPVRPRSKS
jgi:hypothetical protein